MSRIKLLLWPSADVLTWLGDHVTKKSLLKSPVETTEARESWIVKTAIKTKKLEKLIFMTNYVMIEEYNES